MSSGEKPSDEARTALLRQQQDSVVLQIEPAGPHLVLWPDSSKASLRTHSVRMSSKLLAFKWEKKSITSSYHRETLHNVKLVQQFKSLENKTFLISWGEGLNVSGLVTQLNKQLNKLGKRERTGFLVTLREAMLESLFLYLRLVPLSNSFLCCFWHHMPLHRLPRLCGLNDTLLPVWRPPPLPLQGTTTHRMEEMALISFHFSHIKWGRGPGPYAGLDRAG